MVNLIVKATRVVDNNPVMKKMCTLAGLLAMLSAFACAASAKQKPAAPAAPIGWLTIRGDSQKFSVSEQDFRKVSRELPQGMVVPVFKTRDAGGHGLARVTALNFKTGVSELGWTEAAMAEMQPAESFPSDDQLLRLLGPDYYDDVIAHHTVIARFLMRQPGGPAALLCYVLSPLQSMGKLVVFTPDSGKYTLTAESGVPITEIDSGITSIEIRNLLGDGSDCAIIKEHFRELTQTFGTNLYIRRLVSGKPQDLWQAPVHFQNLSQYNSQLHILTPPEKNIGAAGTVTNAEVTFRASGRIQEPVWKGKVEFFVIGREKPLDSVSIEKVCRWNGRAFAALR